MLQDFDIGRELGEVALLLPGAIRRAWTAHATLAYCGRMLRTAEEHARAPEVELPDLAVDREAVGIEDASLDELVSESRLEDGVLHLPHAELLHRLVVECVDDMIATLAMGEEQVRSGSTGFRDRFQGFLAATAPLAGDVVSERYLEAALGPGEAGLQRLVEDLRLALEALQRTLVKESVDGASAYGLAEGDRALVAALMAGLNRTMALKFGGPDLEVTATRSGNDVHFQIDLGRGEPHALVLCVSSAACRLTLADPHLQRVRFFQGLMHGFGIQWTETASRESRSGRGRETYHLCPGSLASADRNTLVRFLEHLGSRLVFLVDWNRARKRLRSFVDGPACLELMRWAADQEVGHRAFLELGGERLIYDAIEVASPTPVRYGQRLDAILGRDAAVDFLRFVLRTASAGLSRQRSERFIRDEIRADLLLRFETLEHGVLAVAAEHALLVGNLAGAVRGALSTPRAADDGLQRNAREWERRADGLVERVRTLARRSPRAKLYARLIGEADDAADDLEESAFLLALPGARSPSPIREVLLPLAGLLVEAADAWKRCLQASAQVTRASAREELQGFLEAVEHLVMLEHQTDDAERRVTAALFGGTVDPQQLLLYARVAEALEKAADALARGALLLRDHFLSEVMTG
jgi:uncharacterized protein Yka (UPF0111/DUF47 family)